MPQTNKSQAARQRDLALNSELFATSETIANARENQPPRRENNVDFRAEWLARRYGLRPALAAVVGELAFAGPRS